MRLARFSTAAGVAGLALLVAFIALSESSAAGIAELVFLVAPIGWLALVGLVLTRGRSGSDQGHSGYRIARRYDKLDP